MKFYYGIRPTGDNLHLGHVMSLLNMFNKIKVENSNVSKIYILLAETHATISTLSNKKIRDNTITLTNKIIALFKSYIEINNLDYNLIDKLYFIYQNNKIGFLHRDITYKFLSLINSNDVLSSPIYKNSSNNSVAFLIYPILQAFDVLLYSNEDEEMTVFVAGDQMANVNLMKEIYSKLNWSKNIKIDIYDNVIYDNKCNVKMSKSLNNFINFDDIDGIVEYVRKYKTFPRPLRDSIGNYKECEFYNNLISFISNFFSLNINHVELCNSGKISCFSCKNKISELLEQIINIYIKYQSEVNFVNFVDEDEIMNNYITIAKTIDDVRSSKNENC